MRRLLGVLVLALAVGAAVLAAGAGGQGEASKNEFRVEFDNAFGLIEGGDLKIAGVRAGKTTEVALDQRTKRAIVSFRIDETGFGSLRADARCSVQPQSLVGEYYVDCAPGTDDRRLAPGSTIPVERTSSTVPPDLVNNILRRPYRERLSFIIAELGAAVAGNAENLNAALRRASPALRETNQVLAILAKQNEVLADLATNADEVLDDLAANRTDVSRFVTEARGAAQVSASRDRDIAAGFRRLPGFLRELRPTMAELGATVDQQGPALQNLARSAGELERLLDNLPPFARASRPALRALGRSSDAGRKALRTATGTVGQLERYSRGVPELGRNLAMTLEHLDDRRFAAEEDPRSPGGKGYTGLEALLQYVFDQTLSTNVHDGETHFLKVFGFEGECAAYADIKRAKEVGEHCSTALGPNMVGITAPDATAPAGYDGADRGRHEEDPDQDPKPTRGVRGDTDGGKASRRHAGAPIKTPHDGSSDRPSAPSPPPGPTVPDAAGVPDVSPDAVKPPLVRELPRIGLSSSARRHDARIQLLEYLFGP